MAVANIVGQDVVLSIQGAGDDLGVIPLTGVGAAISICAENFHFSNTWDEVDVACGQSLYAWSRLGRRDWRINFDVKQQIDSYDLITSAGSVLMSESNDLYIIVITFTNGGPSGSLSGRITVPCIRLSVDHNVPSTPGVPTISYSFGPYGSPPVVTYS